LGNFLRKRQCERCAERCSVAIDRNAAGVLGFQPAAIEKFAPQLSTYGFVAAQGGTTAARRTMENFARDMPEWFWSRATLRLIRRAL